MRKPAHFLAAALSASLLAVSAVASILSLIDLRRNRELLLSLSRSQVELNENLRQLSVRILPAATPPQGRPPVAASVPGARPQAPPIAESAPAVPELSPAAPVPVAALTAPDPAPAAPQPAAPDPARPAPPPEMDLAVQLEFADSLRCFQEARYAEASRRFAAILALRPEDTQARLYYAASLYRANPGASASYPEIERHLQRVLHEKPDDALALELLGQVNAEQERWAEALGCLQRALELRPENPECLRLAGLCALYGGDPATAERYFLRACFLNGTAAELWYLLGLARARAGNLEPAVAAFRRCLELDPGYQEARLRAGLVLLAQGRHEEARQQLREYVRVRPGVEGLAALGDCALALGEVQEAERLWRKSLERLNPVTREEKHTAAELFLKLSRAAWQRRAGQQSLALAERGLLYEPLPLLRALQGIAHLATGQAARGGAILRAVLEEYPGSEAAVLAEEALGREAP